MLCVFAGTKTEERQFANVVIKDEGRGKNLSSILEEYETTESHANTLTRREKVDAFQHSVKFESKEDLAYDDDQEQKEEKYDVKHSCVMLEES